MAIVKGEKDEDLNKTLNESAKINDDTTEEEIYDYFQDIRMTKYLVDLNKFRETVADVFCLADQDCDYSLYDHDDRLKTLMRILDEQVSGINNDQLEKIE